MDEKVKVGFYLGAAMYYDLESDEVDALLASAGLSADEATVAECVAAVREALPYKDALLWALREEGK